MKRFNWVLSAGCALVLLVAAHGLLVWGSVNVSGKIGGWLPWIAGGALIAFGLFHGFRRIHSKGGGYSHLSDESPNNRMEVERGPHHGFLVNLGHGFVEITIFETNVPPRFRIFFYNKNKQVRSVPTRATVTIETVRRSDTRQTFDFGAKGEYLESTTEIPEPHEFKAILQVSHGSHTHIHEVFFGS